MKHRGLKSTSILKMIPILLILETILPSSSFVPISKDLNTLKRLQSTSHVVHSKLSTPHVRQQQQQQHQSYSSRKRIKNQELQMSTLANLFDIVPNKKQFKSVTRSKKIDSPFDYAKDLVYTMNKGFEANRSKNVSGKSLLWPVSSGQKQLGLIERIAKAIYEESAPWITTAVLAMIPSIFLKSSAPLLIIFFAEALFCLYCTFKSITKFNVPKMPEPILRDNWEDVAKQVWSSQRDVSANRDFLMGWFYDAPFDKLRREDALSYLAWMKHGVIYERGMLTKEQETRIEKFDLPLLLEHTNYGKPLPTRKGDEEALPVIRFNCEPLRYRHKPLIFYAVTHGIDMFLHKILKENNFKYVAAENSKKDLSYWYRKPNNYDRENSNPPLVFVHGVGGMAFCYKLIDDLLSNDAIKDDTPIVLVDLPHVSLRLYDDIPSIESQIESLAAIVEKVSIYGGASSNKKATFVGHSFGTILLSWMVQRRPDNIAGCMFIDPVCFNLHLKDILFNFHMQRVDSGLQAGKSWRNPFDAASLRDLAGTEMHTNHAMLRQFSWAANSLWPVDLSRNNIPSTVLLTEKDDIVPTIAVEELFSDFNRKNKHLSHLAEVKVFQDVAHGEMFFMDSLRNETANMVLDLVEKNQQLPSSNIDPISLIKKEYEALLQDTGEFWDQISYILPTRVTGELQTAPLDKTL